MRRAASETRCSVCAHASRARIEASLRGGRTLLVVANAFELSKSALARHRKHMGSRGRKGEKETAPAATAGPLPETDAAEQSAPALPRPMTTEEMCGALERAAQDQVLRLARGDGDLSEIERAKIGQIAVGTIAQLAKLQGRTGVNERQILRSAPWARIQQTIVRTLTAKWPDALTAIGEALVALEESSK